MNFTKLKLEMLIWLSADPKYLRGTGHYILDKTKRVRKTKLSYSCWLKRSTKQDCRIHVIIKYRKNNFEIRLKNSKSCYKNIRVISWFLSKSEGYFVNLHLPGSQTISIDFSELKKQKNTKRTMARRLLKV